MWFDSNKILLASLFIQATVWSVTGAYHDQIRITCEWLWSTFLHIYDKSKKRLYKLLVGLVTDRQWYIKPPSACSASGGIIVLFKTKHHKFWHKLPQACTEYFKTVTNKITPTQKQQHDTCFLPALTKYVVYIRVIVSRAAEYNALTEWKAIEVFYNLKLVISEVIPMMCEIVLVSMPQDLKDD